MIRFNCTVDVHAPKWEDEEMKEAYIKNFLDVINKGLFKMTVPDWEVNVVEVEEIKD